MKRVVVTGMGFITSIGNSYAEVLESLKTCTTGIQIFDEFQKDNIPVKLAGVVKDFLFPTADYSDWIYPSKYTINREDLRSMPPHCVYAYCAMQQAIADAKLPPGLVSKPRTGLLCASGGSMWLAYENLHIMETKGVSRCPPLSIVSCLPGTLNINLGACYHILGSALGFTSACASSAHAFGYGMDLIRQNRQDMVFVVGAEDCNRFSSVPFSSLRALSTGTNPSKTPCAFDKKRDGFLPTGGATVLVLEDLEHATGREAKIYAEAIGWGEASDGYNVVAPEPNGEGLTRCMNNALQDAHITIEQIDYINAHATSTPVGDIAEVRAIKNVMQNGRSPYVSSTKSLTGHGLSLAGALEAGITCIALKERFVPVSAHITELDPECEGVSVVTTPVKDEPKIAMTNSAAFGGANVSLILQRWDEKE